MSSPVHPARSGAAYEASDARPRPLLLFALGLVVLLAGALAVCAWLARRWSAEESQRDEPHPMKPFREGPTAPLLQAVPTAELRAHRKEEAERLNTYGWVDQPNGIAHIPIERALELVAEHGIPAPPQLPEPPEESGR